MGISLLIFTIWNTRMRKITCFLILVIIMGCAAIGPVSSPEFPRLVAKAVPETDGTIQLFGSGSWFPNTRGFTNLRSLSLTQPINPVVGVLAITNKAILFLQWNKEKKAFDVVRRWYLSELSSVYLDTYGFNRRIVVHNKRDLSFDSFDFTKGKGNFVDSEKTEEGYHLLRNLIKKTG